MRLANTRRARVDSFSLVGTMAYEKGAFAFFDGTSSEFAKVLKTDGVIAGYKIVDILTDAVKLEADGKTLELAVGSAMPAMSLRSVVFPHPLGPTMQKNSPSPMDNEISCKAFI